MCVCVSDEGSEASSGRDTPASSSSRHGLTDTDDNKRDKKKKVKAKKKDKVKVKVKDKEETERKAKKKVEEVSEDADKKTKKKGFGLLRYSVCLFVCLSYFNHMKVSY